MPINLEEESRALDQLPEALGESDGVFGREHRLCSVFGGSGALAAMLMRLLIK